MDAVDVINAAARARCRELFGDDSHYVPMGNLEECQRWLTKIAQGYRLGISCDNVEGLEYAALYS